MRVFLVEDDESLGFVVQDNLEQNGYEVDLFKDGWSAQKAFVPFEYDICILDVMLPNLDGFSLGEYIRTQDTQVPIIFLTAKNLKEDRIRGFKIGADDYMTKPFSIEELVLRIEAIMKRIAQSPAPARAVKTTVRIGRYTFDHKNLLLTLDEERTSLTQREADLLALLAEHKGELISRDDILVKIWGETDYFRGRSLDVFITRLRKYLKEDPTVSITNIHGVGFRLEEKV